MRKRLKKKITKKIGIEFNKWYIDEFLPLLNKKNKELKELKNMKICLEYECSYYNEEEENNCRLEIDISNCNLFPVYIDDSDDV